jgi:hypothetical protein
MRLGDRRLGFIVPASLLATAPALAHALAVEASAPYQTVSHWNSSSQCVTSTHWTATTENLVKATLPNEWPASWDPDALKAGASIIRQNSWELYNHKESDMFCSGVSPYAYDWRDSKMTYVAGSEKSATNSATSATYGSGWYSSDYSANDLYMEFGDTLQWDTQALASPPNNYGWVDIVSSSTYPPGVYSAKSPDGFHYSGIGQAVLYK